MDISMITIFLPVFLACCMILFLVYKYGIREKSYEEALAEQRQQHSQVLLSNKVKPKDKKNKKAAKKSKDKDKNDEDAQKQNENKHSELGEGSRPETPQKHHVEFKKEAEEVPPKEPSVNKKKIKKDVRPILINKEDVEKVVDAGIEEIPPANHFEEIHPKDEFELLRANSREELLKPAKERSKAKHHDSEQPKKKEDHLKQESVKEKPKAKEQNNDQNKKKAKTIEPEILPVAEKEKAKENKIVAVEKEIVREAKAVAPEKEKHNVHEKDKQKDVKAVASEKEKSKEVKPVQLEKDKLKDLKLPVVEKEKPKEAKPPATNVVVPQTNGMVGNHGKEKKKKKSDFNNLQQLAVEKDGVNMPILLNLVRKAELSRSEVQILIDLLLNKQHEAPVIVDDWSEGKSDPVQKLKKQLAEKEKALLEEQEALAGAQAKLREIRNEQLGERSQLQQKIHGLEEILQNKQLELQGLNGRFHGQTQQYQQLQAQLNEERAGMQMQIQQYEIRLAQTQEAEGIIVQLRADVQALSEQNQQMRIELQRMAEEKEHHQGVIMQLNGFQEELKQKTDQIRHLESTLDITRRKEGDYSVEITRLESICQQNLESIRDLEIAKNHALEEVRNMKNQKEETDGYISQLTSELQKVKQEKAQMEDKHANGSLEENKSQKVEILNLHNALSSMKNELQQKEKNYRTELDSSRIYLEKLETELREQKEKNDELRTRNWKVMEALNAAENRIKNYTKAESGTEKLLAEAQNQEFQKQKEFVLRLFPDIGELKSIKAGPSEWQSQCGAYITEYITKLKTDQQKSVSPSPTASKDELAQLQQENLFYRGVIDETEERLNKIQACVQEEEIQWRKQLQVKEDECQALKQQFASQLKDKVGRLEKDLEGVQIEKQKFEEECRLLQSRVVNKPGPADAVATIEKLTEEINRLREQVRIEQTKNRDVNSCPKTLSNCNSTNGPSHLQRCLSTSSSNASSLHEVTIRKPKNKKKKKKESGKLED